MTDRLSLPESRKLFVIGDSFSVSPMPSDPTMTWTRATAQKLAALHQEPVLLVNSSMMGVSQDYMWQTLQAWIADGVITDQDYLIVALTHASRFWYLERDPGMSNSNIIDLDRYCSPEECRAIELFIKHIQRPSLDAIHLNNRMGWLSYQVLKQGLRKPSVIKGFDQLLLEFEQSDELLISQGSLFEDIQYWEFADLVREENNGYWQGIDCRYNHMCLSNHEILSDRVSASLFHQTQLNITDGFHRGLLTDNAVNDLEFCQQQLDMNALKYRTTQLKKPYYKPILPWLKRAGIAPNNSIRNP
jgi:hypothetical protein